MDFFMQLLLEYFWVRGKNLIKGLIVSKLLVSPLITAPVLYLPVFLGSVLGKESRTFSEFDKWVTPVKLDDFSGLHKTCGWGME